MRVELKCDRSQFLDYCWILRGIWSQSFSLKNPGDDAYEILTAFHSNRETW